MDMPEYHLRADAGESFQVVTVILVRSAPARGRMLSPSDRDGEVGRTTMTWGLSDTRRRCETGRRGRNSGSRGVEWQLEKQREMSFHQLQQATGRWPSSSRAGRALRRVCAKNLRTQVLQGTFPTNGNHHDMQVGVPTAGPGRCWLESRRNPLVLPALLSGSAAENCAHHDGSS